MEQAKTHYEVIVVGAGVAGIYQIKRLVDLGIESDLRRLRSTLQGPACRYNPPILSWS
jgi:heterodisulfide reductase subunit A-like polyferredoxin